MIHKQEGRKILMLEQKPEPVPFMGLKKHNDKMKNSFV
jgi:hypothetical protein